ncbi:MAG: HEAT repeat domain-containing protein [Verrucomicrobiae bacterium]|nr:HEAT repeat domain-containing protein [Verrucomicrobiae bacterium]
MVKFHTRTHGRSISFLAALLMWIGLSQVIAEIRCGAAKVDISPVSLPAIQNGGFLEALIQRNADPLHARAMVFDDGADKIAIVVVDSCMIPRNLCDEAKALAHEQTGIAIDRMLISATHTHAAPSVMDYCLGSRKDPAYTKFLPGKIAEAIVAAHAKRVPARIGFAVADASEFTKNRRWIRRSDKMVDDPFGERTVQAMMHPGYQNPDFVGPSGPVDPELSLLNIQTLDGKPLGLLANFSMHYFSGHPGASSDYYGRFAEAMHGRLAPGEKDFVAIMSQGTSGDLWWGDYALPKAQTWDIIEYTNRLAALAEGALQGIQYNSDGDIAMSEERTTFGRRLPDEKRLAWADEKLKEMGDHRPRNQPEVYAEQARWIAENPTEEVTLQAVRIGDIAITGLPNEVYAITGLKLKERSPHAHTFNMSLANGAAGYIPPPEQHALGGYTTWPARTAGLEVDAEPKMVTMLEKMLGSLTADGRGRADKSGALDLQPLPAEQRIAYLNFADLEVPNAKGRMAFAVPGIESPLAADGRALGFAGGSYSLPLPDVAAPLSIELWIWNGFPNNARDITGYVYSLRNHVLGISGTAATAPGRLFFANELGRTELMPRAWNHIVVTTDGRNTVSVYLNGNPEPEIQTTRAHSGPSILRLGSDGDDTANFEGRIEEVSLFSKAFTPEQVAERFRSFGIAAPIKPEWGEPRDPEPEKPKTSQMESAPLSPAETIAATHVADGFVLELVAAEPEIADPVAIDWGLDGKLWVAEMADYPYGMDGEGKPGGRVRYLEDTDGDGRYEKSTLFVDGLRFPTSVMAWRDGVLITAAPDLIFANDPDGDGVAQTKVLFSGFVQGNQQLRVNSLRWGLDNRVHCASGGHHVGFGKDTVIVNAAGDAVALGSRDFRFDPDTGVLEPESGPSQFGRVRDDWGNWFGVQNSWPLWHYVLPDRYLRRNPSFAPPDPRVQVRAPGNPRIYPNKAIQRRFHSYEQAGRYTSACGPSIYRDDVLFPGSGESMTAFTCEPFHNVVQRHRVQREGVSFKGERADDGDFDFFASGDRWCRPVMSRTGPDGGLYIVDMYRYMIEHPDWLPPNGREELKPFYRSGDDRGRIYRIRKIDAPLRKVEPVDVADVDQLILSLQSPNGVLRDLAHRYLLSSTLAEEHKNTLVAMVLEGSQTGQLHALCVLDGKSALSTTVLMDALKSGSSGLRRNAIRIAESHEASSSQLVERLTDLSRDPDPSVRLQAIFSLGEVEGDVAGEALVAAAKNPSNTGAFFNAAIMSSASRHIEALVAAVDELSEEFARPLFALAWGGPAMAPLLRATTGETVRGLELTADYFATMDERGKGGIVANTEAAKELEWLETVHIPSITRRAGQLAADRTHTVDHRLAAIRLLGRNSNGLAILEEVLNSVDESEALRLAALDRLLTNDAYASGKAFDWYAPLPPVMRVALIDLSLRRKPATLALLGRIKSGAIPAISIPAAQRQQLLSSNDDAIRAMAEECFTPLVKTDRTETIAALAVGVHGLNDTGTGAATFEARCATCHSMKEGAARVGPDLRSITDRSIDGLLTAIVDPSRSVDPGYVGVTAELKNGETLYGRVHSETGAGYNLLLLDGTMKGIARESLSEIRLAQTSLMPDGLGAGLTPQQLADLLGYLRGLGSGR